MAVAAVDAVIVAELAWLVIEPADEAKVALVADEAKVAFVAEEAAPLKVAVIVPALKLPDASLATTLLAVFRLVASTANVRAAEPLKVPPLVKNEPAVNALATEPAEPVVFWFKVGNVQLARFPEDGVPSSGVVKLGEVVSATTVPEPEVE